MEALAVWAAWPITARYYSDMSPTSRRRRPGTPRAHHLSSSLEEFLSPSSPLGISSTDPPPPPTLQRGRGGEAGIGGSLESLTSSTIVEGNFRETEEDEEGRDGSEKTELGHLLATAGTIKLETLLPPELWPPRDPPDPGNLFGIQNVIWSLI